MNTFITFLSFRLPPTLTKFYDNFIGKCRFIFFTHTTLRQLIFNFRDHFNCFIKIKKPLSIFICVVSCLILEAFVHTSVHIDLNFIFLLGSKTVNWLIRFKRTRNWFIILVSFTEETVCCSVLNVNFHVVALQNLFAARFFRTRRRWSVYIWNIYILIFRIHTLRWKRKLLHWWYSLFFLRHRNSFIRLHLYLMQLILTHLPMLKEVLFNRRVTIKVLFAVIVSSLVP